MASVIVGESRRTRVSPTAVAARIASQPRGKAATRPNDEAVVVVHVADRRMASAIVRSVHTALKAAISKASTPTRSVRFRTARRLADLEGDDALRGAIAIIRVTRQNSVRLSDYVDRALAAGAVGAQLVWDGADPSRSRAERHVFAVLERARANPKGPPIILARSDGPLEILELKVESQRAQNAHHEEKR